MYINWCPQEKPQSMTPVDILYIVYRIRKAQNTRYGNEVIITNKSSVPYITWGTEMEDIKLKEICILGLFFALFSYSVISFLKIWNKTYRDVGAFYHFEHPRINDSPRRASSIKGTSESR